MRRWIIAFANMPATTSSSIIPHPPLIFPASLINRGFTISKNRNAANANNKIKILFGTKSIDTHIPTTSSITILEGSLPHSGISLSAQ